MKRKVFWKSKAFWASALVTILALCRLADNYLGTNLTSGGVADLLMAVGGMFGIYGRAVADSALTLKND